MMGTGAETKSVADPGHVLEAAAPALRFPFGLFRRKRFENGILCPRCGSSQVRSWGSFSGRRRYRCRGCLRTFSDFTSTHLAYIKRSDCWPNHCASMLRAESLRREAARLRIHRDTAFRWRHRVLRALEASDSSVLHGLVATRETTFPISEKGSRELDRPARRRGWRMGQEWLGAPAVWVIFAQDTNGRVASAIADRGRPTPSHYSRALAHRLAEDVRLTSSHGPAGAPATFARRNGLRYVDPRRGEQQRFAVSMYVMRMRAWLRRFRGVATRYLANYLVWHRFLHLEELGRSGSAVERLLVGSFG